MHLLGRLLAIAVLSVGLASTAGAAGRIALVIGNGAYTDIPALANPKNDADLMAQTLEAVGFEVTKVTDADQATMKRAMLEFGRQLREGAEASLFYYAGHAVESGGRNYLIPVHAAIAAEGELDLEAVDVNAFLRVMEGSPSKVNIVILDACRNNPFPSRFRSATRGLAMVDAPRGTYIAYSTTPGEVAVDGTGANSPYTRALADAIARPGLKLEETFKQVRRAVLEETADRQTPWETSSITGDFFFARGSAAPDPAAPTVLGDTIATDYAFAERIGTEAAWEAFLARHQDAPDSFYVKLATEARKRLTLASLPPVTDAPAVDAPVVDVPVVDTPVVDTPADDLSADDLPAKDGPAEEDDGPAEDEPVVNEAAINQPVINVPLLERPGSDSRAAGGVFSDSFETFADSWGSPDEQVFVENGAMVLEPTPGFTTWVTNSAGSYDDADVRAVVTTVRSVNAADAFAGLMFWHVDDENYYALQIDADGYASVWRRQNGKWLAQVEWVSSDLVNKGDGAANELRVVIRGAQASYYINGGLFSEATGMPPQDGHKVGIIGSSPDSAAARYEFDDFTVAAVEEVAAVGSRIPGTLLSDGFDRLDPTWGREDESFTVRDGMLHILPELDLAYYALSRGSFYNHVDYSADILAIDADDAGDSYAGLIFWAINGENNHSFLITADGYAAVFRRENDESVAVVDWRPFDAVNKGKGAFNTLRVVAGPDSATVYVNGQVFDTISGSPPESGWQVGLRAASPKAWRADYGFDNVLVVAAGTE